MKRIRYRPRPGRELTDQMSYLDAKEDELGLGDAFFEEMQGLARLIATGERTGVHVAELSSGDLRQVLSTGRFTKHSLVVV
jgi:hypothetical protein